ncbi:MAG: hypothetical protein ACK55Z_05550, partial [bacterium]
SGRPRDPATAGAGLAAGGRRSPGPRTACGGAGRRPAPPARHRPLGGAARPESRQPQDHRLCGPSLGRSGEKPRRRGPDPGAPGCGQPPRHSPARHSPAAGGEPRVPGHPGTGAARLAPARYPAAGAAGQRRQLASAGHRQWRQLSGGSERPPLAQGLGARQQQPVAGAGGWPRRRAEPSLQQPGNRAGARPQRPRADLAAGPPHGQRPRPTAGHSPARGPSCAPPPPRTHGAPAGPPSGPSRGSRAPTRTDSCSGAHAGANT